MAKRGYRGKHPYNDAKVSKNPVRAKYDYDKLTKEYKKLKNDKQKYDYIRTHYYYPQSTCTLTIAGNPAEGTNLVLTSTDGTSVTYVASSSEATNEFLPADPSGSLATVINSGHQGKIIAVASAGEVVLTQREPGPDGNTAVSGSTNLISASLQSGVVSTNGTFTF